VYLCAAISRDTITASRSRPHHMCWLEFGFGPNALNYNMFIVR